MLAQLTVCSLEMCPASGKVARAPLCGTSDFEGEWRSPCVVDGAAVVSWCGNKHVFSQ